MAFVKLDCRILDSTIWVDRSAREVFITALLMAEPREFDHPLPRIAVRSTEPTGDVIPAGWYGFAPAAGPGIVRRAGLDLEEGMAALERLCSPDNESRSPEFDGMRMARVDGGYIILNFMKYRDRDYTGAERARRYRERKMASRVTNVTSRVTNRDDTVTQRDVTVTSRSQSAEDRVQSNTQSVAQSRSEIAESIYQAYPRKVGKQDALKQIEKALRVKSATDLLAVVQQYASTVAQWPESDQQFIPYPGTWFNRGHYDDDPACWTRETAEKDAVKNWQST